MKTIPATQARSRFYRLMDEVAEAHAPVLLTGRRNCVVMLPEEDWNDIQETLHVMSVPGLRAELIQGRDLPMSECCDETALPW